MSRLLANTLKVLVSELNNLKSTKGGQEYEINRLQKQITESEATIKQLKDKCERQWKEIQSAQASEKAAVELLLQKEVRLKKISNIPKLYKHAIGEQVIREIKKALK